MSGTDNFSNKLLPAAPEVQQQARFVAGIANVLETYASASLKPIAI